MDELTQTQKCVDSPFHTVRLQGQLPPESSVMNPEEAESKMQVTTNLPGIVPGTVIH